MKEKKKKRPTSMSVKVNKIIMKIHKETEKWG